MTCARHNIGGLVYIHSTITAIVFCCEAPQIKYIEYWIVDSYIVYVRLANLMEALFNLAIANVILI